jgi:hypothetical protein
MRANFVSPLPVPARRISTSALVLYACAVALGLGISSASIALRGDYPFGGIEVGPWKAWPQVGSREADPYARAIVTRRAEIPLAVGEGLALTATRDSTGRDLDSACTYRVGNTTPQARLWTLTLYDSAGPIRTELQRAGYTSAEILREGGGTFSIVLSRAAHAGNWVQLPAGGPFSIVLRLYDTPAAVGSANLEESALPAIERMECGA